MRPEEVKALLSSIRDGSQTVDEVAARLSRSPVDDLGFARLDTHRELRQGAAEAIYGEGKTADQTVSIAQALLERSTGAVLATRVPDANARALLERFPEAEHHVVPRLVVLRRAAPLRRGSVAVLSAGTSDLAVAEEAAITAETLGLDVDRVIDVGVAGVHRLLADEQRIREADAVVVVAGMEGALASLVGGLTPAPVVAVPTSVGYGASFEGLAALLTMLNSCAAGITVTNIDNGFGAAMFAFRLLDRR